MQAVTFLCLGTMGYPMAGHLARAGYPVRVYNRTAARAEAWCAEYDGALFSTAREAAEGAAFVLLCSGNDADVREVVLADAGALAGMQAGSVLVDHTTASPGLAREIAERAEGQGVAFLDAPVSGGQSGAEQGVLTVMVGGEAETFARALPVLDTYARKVVHMGPAGSGQLTKMVNQVCIAGLVQALAEGLNFAERSGLDVPRVIEAISGGAAQSWQMDNRAETMIAGSYDFGFAVDWMRKDLEIALAEAKRCGAELPVTALVDGFYAELQAGGGGRLDTSSLLARLVRD